MKLSNLMAAACCAAGAAGCSGSDPGGDNSGLLTLMVGSYSEAGDSALRVYTFDPASARFECTDTLPVANASYFVEAPGGMIYAVTESTPAESSVTALRRVAGERRFEVANSQPVGSDSPCYIEVSPDGRFVVTANYGGGDVTVFPLAADGSLMPCRQVLRLEGSGSVAGRQEMPHPHCIAFTPDGRYMLVDDLGTDRIHQYALSPSGSDSLVSGLEGDIILRSGSGPRHIVFDKSGTTAYLINELADNVTVLRYDGLTLAPVQYEAADSAGVGGAADIHLSPDGCFLYASLRLRNDGIVTYGVDPSSGLLTYLGHTPTLAHPRNFTLTPDGRQMLVASRDGNAVQVLAVDSVSGLPVVTEHKLEVSRPVCVKVLE